MAFDSLIQDNFGLPVVSHKILMVVCLDNGLSDASFLLAVKVFLLTSGVRKRVVSKGWFWQMFPCTGVSSQLFSVRCTLAEGSYDFDNPESPNTRNEGTFAKIALLQNHPFAKPPFCSEWIAVRLFNDSGGTVS